MELRTERFKLKEKFPNKAKKYAQKLHIKADNIEFVRKGIPIDPKDITIKDGERAAIRLITTPHLDRDGEILIPSGAVLDDFRQSPSVLWAHDYKGLPIGHDQWLKIGKEGIVAKTLYAKHQFAEDVYQCVKHKDLNSNSVGFIPIEGIKKDDDKKGFSEWQDVLEKDYGISKDESGKAKTIYTKWLMLEHSDVPVASNAQSLNLAIGKGEVEIKTERLKKDLEIEIVKDVEDREIEIEWVKEECKHEWIDFTTRDSKQNIKVYKCNKCGAEKEVANKSEVEDKEIEVVKDSPSGETANLEQASKETVYNHNLSPEAVIITKPETTDKYHHIPVNPRCKITATITISASKGIKATYCGEVKKIHTYLFDVNKWTMKEAQAWVEENHKREVDEWVQKAVESEPQYKERWNKSLSKLFDIASAQNPKPLKFHYELYEKFLECKVKEIFQNSYVIPSPLLGTYLAGFKEILSEFELKDTRKFTWDSSEIPPDHEVIQLNSEKSDDFLISGMCFYEAEKKPLIINFSPDFYGLNATLTTSNENKEWNKELLDKVHSWAYENNFLRGEKFALSGEFLNEPPEDWDSLIVDSKYKDAIQKSVNFLGKKGKNLVGRGLLFIGPPGTGKTKTGRVLMSESDATFIWVSSRDFRNAGPLKGLSLGFKLARDLAPSILFLEDIDFWLSEGMEYVTDLVKTEMDGIKQNKGMITILTSNYPEKLPNALLDRPGRFHHIVNFDLPKDTQREEMLNQWAGEIEEALLKDIIEKTEGFSGAHIKELVEFARMIAEEEEIEMGKALVKSLDKLTEQRELIEVIRANKTDIKSVWGNVKYIDGEIKVKADTKVEYECECIDCGHKLTTDKHCVDIKCPECGGEMRRAGRPGPGRGYEEKELDDFPEQLRKLIDTIREQYDKVLDDKDEIIAELKEGRVLSRKNRKIVKDAVLALNAVLKADSAGSREDEETEESRELEIEVVKDGEKSFTMDEIKQVIKNVLPEKAQEILEQAIKASTDPERIKKLTKEAVRLEIAKRCGKVE